MMAVSQVGLGQRYDLLREVMAEVDPRFMPSGTAADLAARFGREEIVRAFKPPEQISQQNVRDVLLRVISALRNDDRGGLVWRHLMASFGMPVLENQGPSLADLMEAREEVEESQEEKEEEDERRQIAWVKANAPKVALPVAPPTKLESRLHECLYGYAASVEEANSLANKEAANILDFYGWKIDNRLHSLIVDIPANPVEHSQRIDEVLSKFEFTPGELTQHLDNYKYDPGTTPQYYAQSPAYHAVQASAREKVAQQGNHLWQHLRDALASKCAISSDEDPAYSQFMKEGADRHARCFAIAAACQGVRNVHAPIPGGKNGASFADVCIEMYDKVRAKELRSGYSAQKIMRATVGESFQDGNLPDVKAAFTTLIDAISAVQGEKSAPRSQASSRMSI